jgi:pseudouridine kinase
VSNNVTGHAVTPFVLSLVEKLTHGKSLDANISLILNNAKIAAEISKEYISLVSRSRQPINQHHVDFYTQHGSQYLASSSTTANINNLVEDAASPPSSSSPPAIPASEVLVFGGAVIDLIGRSSSPLIMRSSNPGEMATSYGGVGRNIAQRLALHNKFKISLVSAVADDAGGQGLIRHAASIGIDTSKLMILPSLSTATYTAIHDADGDLSVGIADMSIFNMITPEFILARAGDVRLSNLVICDGNISPQSFSTLMKICHSYSVPVFFEPTSDHKCLLPVTTKTLHRVRNLHCFLPFLNY